ncbi:hypothetical protein GCU60_03855 [Blastococcus saxobsidens]|uniref:Uncharacterized protein n=1 Tax=Blastococcus saxobsidens TaxID=138336 RepID=A0A6L9VZN1_9ACTN|nr:hypothetical protein [Blastococcus saxobsidens]NEK84899.1 hypothetical protein [Blastococcus saxobsidens]
MSSPRDGDRDGFDDGDGSGWREPPHLGSGGAGEDEADQPNFVDRRKKPRDDQEPLSARSWQPPGWDLPAAEPQRPVPPPAAGPAPDEARPPLDAPPPQGPPQAGPPPEDAGGPQQPAAGAPGWLGGGRGRRRTPGAADHVFAYQGDLVGSQGWALQQGWTVSDGTAPEDAPLAGVIASSPVRATKDHRAGNVLRGRAGPLELVAFDVVYASGRYVVPEYAITAAPLLGSVPGFRLSPSRFWRHRTGGMVPLGTGDPAFDARWLLLAAEDDPRLHRLAQDPAVHGLLLGTDDGDEFWSGAGHVSAVRPDGHRPQLLEHHARLLSAIVAALGAGGN